MAGYYSGENSFWKEAERWTKRLESRVESDSVFRGFLFYYAGSVGSEIASSKLAEDLAMRAASSLKATFNPKTGLMPLGKFAEEAHTVGESETNIDSISASLVVAWAAEKSNDEELKLVAVKHALRNGDFCVREDGSVCQSASFDSDSGELLNTYTHKGFSESSTWARAQAWAMMGYSYLSSKFPENDDLYTLAESTCRWWINNVPDDLVSAWDFDAPNSGDIRKDTSATAIAAYAMLRFSSIHKDRNAARKYYKVARATVWNLCEGYLTPENEGDQRPVGILTAGCFDPNRGTAVDNELIWGDYFLFKSLGILTGILPIIKPS